MTFITHKLLMRIRHIAIGLSFVTMMLSCKNEDVTKKEAEVIKEERNCHLFKTGTFIYDDADYDGWYVMRNDTLSVEMNDATNEQIISKITWLNDCTYVLKYVSHATIPDFQVPKNDIKVTILSTYNDVYFCEVQDSMNNFRLTMKKQAAL